MKKQVLVNIASVTFLLSLLSACQACLDVEKAVSVIYPTEGSRVFGKVTFEPAKEGGVQISALLYNLAPGEHGFHIHQYGDCSSADGSAAGGHFNPGDMSHASPSDDNRHVGDIGNVIANQSGIAILKYRDPHMKLMGVKGIIGRSLVIHEKEDDLKTQPSGNSGGRVGCGVIGIAQ